jgi:hypothetical protein
MFPYNSYARPQGIFSGLKNLTKGVTLTGFLDGAQKTLGVINQAIPIVHQVGPMITNARTMFKIADVINTPDKTYNNYSNVENTNVQRVSTTSDNKPIFYI